MNEQLSKMNPPEVVINPEIAMHETQQVLNVFEEQHGKHPQTPVGPDGFVRAGWSEGPNAGPEEALRKADFLSYNAKRQKWARSLGEEGVRQYDALRTARDEAAHAARGQDRAA